MPRQAPTRGDRFDIGTLYTDGMMTFTSSAQQQYIWNIPFIHEHTRNGGTHTLTVCRTEWLREFREAGMWFADIAHILQYPSASSASAAYVRECRRLGVEPQVRAENRRAQNIIQQIREVSASHRPEFLNRDHFGGEFGDFGFGVEIEQVGLNLRELVGITSRLGYPTNTDTSYSHQDPTRWKAVPDGSLRGPVTGECVSRVLRGYDGLVELRDVMLNMKQAGSRTNASCGQHIHIGIEPFSVRTQAMVIRAHQIFQQVFDMLVNPLRRNHADYARHTPWTHAMFNAECFETGNQSGAYLQKYHSLNLNKYSQYGTFEFRSFHGCLNPRHTVAWLQLHFDFFMLCEKVARLTSQPTTDLLHFDRDNAEATELMNKLPLTMKYLLGLREQTAWGATDLIWQFMGDTNGYGTTQTACAEQVFSYAMRGVYRDGAGLDPLTLDDSAHRLIFSPEFAEVGLNGPSNYIDGMWHNNRGLEHARLFPLDRADSRYGVTGVRTVQKYEDNTLNALAVWALPILQEWVCNDDSFIGNAQVRKALRELAVKQFPMLNEDSLGGVQGSAV